MEWPGCSDHFRKRHQGGERLAVGSCEVHLCRPTREGRITLSSSVAATLSSSSTRLPSSSSVVPCSSTSTVTGSSSERLNLSEACDPDLQPLKRGEIGRFHYEVAYEIIGKTPEPCRFKVSIGRYEPEPGSMAIRILYEDRALPEYPKSRRHPSTRGSAQLGHPSRLWVRMDQSVCAETRGPLRPGGRRKNRRAQA
jgi:hypothetical protein